MNRPLSKNARTIIAAIEGMTEIEAVTYVVKNTTFLDAQEILTLLGAAIKHPDQLKDRFLRAEQYSNGWYDAETAWDDVKSRGDAAEWARFTLAKLEALPQRDHYQQGTVDSLKKALEHYAKGWR